MKGNVDISAVEDHGGILTIRGGGARRLEEGCEEKNGGEECGFHANHPALKGGPSPEGLGLAKDCRVLSELELRFQRLAVGVVAR